MRSMEYIIPSFNIYKLLYLENNYNNDTCQIYLSFCIYLSRGIKTGQVLVNNAYARKGICKKSMMIFLLFVAFSLVTNAMINTYSDLKFLTSNFKQRVIS